MGTLASTGAAQTTPVNIKRKTSGRVITRPVAPFGGQTKKIKKFTTIQRGGNVP